MLNGYPEALFVQSFFLFFLYSFAHIYNFKLFAHNFDGEMLEPKSWCYDKVGYNPSCLGVVGRER